MYAAQWREVPPPFSESEFSSSSSAAPCSSSSASTSSCPFDAAHRSAVQPDLSRKPTGAPSVKSVPIASASPERAA